jgi:hypothetical protein
VQTLLGIFLVGVTLAVLAIMIRDAVRGTTPLISLRNVFLSGVLIFQTVSGAITALGDVTEKGAELSYPVSSCAAFCLVITLFIVVFLLTYRLVDLDMRAQLRSCTRSVTDGRLVAVGMMVLTIGLAMRFAGAGLPILEKLLPQMAAGALAAAVMLLSYVWIRNPFNPIFGFFLLIGAALSAGALLVDAFGRRELLGVGLASVWGFYQGRWKSGSAISLARRLAIGGAVAFIPVVLFSAVRTSINDRRTAAEQVERVLELDFRAIEEATIGMLSGQFAAGVSMWTYETRPGDFAVDPLHSLAFFFAMPVPRDLWPGKPDGLGLLLVDQALLNGVSSGHSWGPGLVGHLFHDFVYISLPLYAFILGAVLKYLDQRVQYSSGDPLTLACFGAALGQVIGLPRGELGLFAFNMVTAMVGARFAMALGPVFLVPRLPRIDTTSPFVPVSAP